MSRITTKIVWDMNTGEVLEHIYTKGYDGPWALAGKDDKKKEKRRQAEITAQAMKLAAAAAAERARQQALAEGYWSKLIPTEPGKMSPYAEGQYNSELEKVRNTYDNLRMSGLRNLAVRGFNRAPSGMAASITNTANEAQGEAETEAYRNALARTYEQGVMGAQGFERLAGQNDPYSGLSIASGSNAVSLNRQPPNTLAAIGAGLAGVGSVAKDLNGIFRPPDGIIKN